MKTLVIAFGFAVILAVLVELMFSYLAHLLGIDPQWHWLVLLIAGLIGLSMVVWGVYGLATKETDDDINVQLIFPDEVITVKDSKWKKIIKWLKEH